jgi:hypothetical protein
MDKLIKLAMNIAADDNTFSLWKIENSPWIHRMIIIMYSFLSMLTLQYSKRKCLV